ncbi:DUF934 domain-containing protein [Sessilibacter corallicola]|uniref:DUF934 domain-containing protein n=1 Tax=Sessilibacter corallicola TaxID=2904075 RepID=A0ABQ0ACQ7_9GAMM
MPKLINNGVLEENVWQTISEPTDVASLPEGKVLLPLAFVQANIDEITISKDNLGIIILPADSAEDSAPLLDKVSVVAFEFQNFMDGRGFSQARIVREELGFKGEVRATGQFIRDQLLYLKRCGFNAFEFGDESVDVEAALASLSDFTEYYQAGVDEPKPLYQRR